jgi:hypothetical protein
MEKKNQTPVMIFSIVAAVLLVIAVFTICYIVLKNDKPDNMAVERDSEIDTGIKVDFETDESAKEDSTLALDGTIVHYQVAEGYYSTSEFEDEFSATECFSGENKDVLVNLCQTDGENAEYHAKIAAESNAADGAEMVTETVDEKIVYYCSYSYVYHDVQYQYLEAFCDVNQDVYYWVELESRGNQKLEFDNIRDFFIFY